MKRIIVFLLTAALTLGSIQTVFAAEDTASPDPIAVTELSEVETSEPPEVTDPPSEGDIDAPDNGKTDQDSEETPDPGEEQKDTEDGDQPNDGQSGEDEALPETSAGDSTDDPSDDPSLIDPQDMSTEDTPDAETEILATAEQPQRLATPVLTGVSNITGGIRITWNPVTGAAKYRILYRAGSGGWQTLADTAGTSYTWTQPSPAVTYAFTVLCLNEKSEAVSDYNTTGLSTCYMLETPVITGVANVKGGLKISWNAVPGAAKYRLFYKSGSSLKKITDTASTSYTWKGGKVDTSYTFVVCCLSGDGQAYTSADSGGASGTFYKLPTPARPTVTNTSSAVTIKWKKVSGAARYRLYYKTGKNGSWKKLTNTTSTSYTWKKAKYGKTYYFTVRCISKNGKSYTSSFDRTGSEFVRLKAPKISKITAAQAGITIKWKKSSGAAKYYIYRKSGKSWKWIAESPTTSCTVSVPTGINYHYTVRAVKNSSTSTYDSAGKTFKLLATPKLSSVSASSSAVKIKWKKVSGAEKYRVYSRTGNGGWKKIGETTSTSYSWTSYKPLTVYDFTVRCITKKGGKHTSGYNSTGKSVQTKAYQNPSKYFQIRDSIQLSGGGYTIGRGYEGLKTAWVIKKLKVRGGKYVGMGYGKCVYDSAVEKAVKKFQKANGLPATGKVDLATWIAMGYTEQQWYDLGSYVSPVRAGTSASRSEHIEAMISRAYDYLGTSYVVGASGAPGTGVDCSGLVMQALYAGGLDMSSINPVRHAKPGYEYESRNMWKSSKFKHVSYSQRQRGDLIFYQKGGSVIHVAIYLGNNKVIESWPNKVVVWPIKNSHRSNIKGVVRPFV